MNCYATDPRHYIVSPWRVALNVDGIWRSSGGGGSIFGDVFEQGCNLGGGASITITYGIKYSQGGKNASQQSNKNGLKLPRSWKLRLGQPSPCATWLREHRALLKNFAVYQVRTVWCKHCNFGLDTPTREPMSLRCELCDHSLDTRKPSSIK